MEISRPNQQTLDELLREIEDSPYPVWMNRLNQERQLKEDYNETLKQAEKQSSPSTLLRSNATRFQLYTSFGIAYMVNLYVGSQSAEFKMLLDTGSSYTWLTSPNCKSCEMLNITKHFDCDKSTTCANQTHKIDLTYGKGSLTSTMFRDTLGFNHNSLVAKDQDFLIVENLFNLKYFPAQGLVGLGFQSLSDGRKTVFDNLKEQGSIPKRLFAISLSGDAKDLKFGLTSKDFFIIGGDGVDQELVNSSDSFTCPVAYQPYWSVEIASILPIIADVEMNIGMKPEIALIDTGSSFIVLNEADFAVFRVYLGKLNKLKCVLDERYGLMKCESQKVEAFPTFKVVLCAQSRPILVSPKQYLLCDKNFCYIRISSIATSFFTKKIIILGDIFIQSQYIVFNQDDMNISFYQKKQQQQQQSQGKTTSDRSSASKRWRKTKVEIDKIRKKINSLEQRLQRNNNKGNK